MKRHRVGELVAILAVAGLVGSGCGGVSGSHSVSPGSFFLPGLIRYEGPRPSPAGEPLPANSDSNPNLPEITGQGPVSPA